MARMDCCQMKPGIGTPGCCSGKPQTNPMIATAAHRLAQIGLELSAFAVVRDLTAPATSRDRVTSHRVESSPAPPGATLLAQHTSLVL
jgi:hypothetical protein